MSFDDATLDAIRSANPLADVLARDYGRAVKPHGPGRKRVLCVFHKESDASLVLNENTNIFKCYGCGEHGDVFTLVMKLDGLTFPQAVEKLSRRAGIQLNGNGSARAAGKRTVVAWYCYRDESGALLFQVERTDPKGFQQRIPDGKGGWRYSLDGVRRVLYRLPEVLRATGEIWIVEGEKDCDTLAGLGFTATTNSGGAGKWREEYNDALRGKPVVIVPDNDLPGLKHADAVARALHAVDASVRVVRLPDKVKDVTDFVGTFTDKTEAAERLGIMAEGAGEYHPDTNGKELNAALEAATSATPARPAAPVLEFLRPSELRDYRPPEGIVLVGDCHIVRGSVFVIGGAPGVGKSRAVVALAVAGATGADWFGLKVHARFRTMIVQSENGRFRLSREFADLDCSALEDFVRVCPPPPLGLAFDSPEFQSALAKAIADFQPDVIVVDPWNAVARDEKAKDYLETFNLIRAVVPTGDNAPALGIVAHTRKPKGDERTTGRGLLNLLAGSYVLGSVPRTVFVMQSASDDPDDDRIVWTCCKNNDGELGQRTAWQRRNGLFASVAVFDWTEFDSPSNTGSHKVSVQEVAEAIGVGNCVAYSRLAESVAEKCEVSERTAKDAIKRAAEAKVIRKGAGGLYEVV